VTNQARVIAALGCACVALGLGGCEKSPVGPTLPVKLTVLAFLSGGGFAVTDIG
jgi:hypothetical protein